MECICGRTVKDEMLSAFVVKGYCERIPSQRVYIPYHKVDGFKVRTIWFSDKDSRQYGGSITLNVERRGGKNSARLFCRIVDGKVKNCYIQYPNVIRTMFVEASGIPKKYQNIIKFAEHMYQTRCK